MNIFVSKKQKVLEKAFDTALKNLSCNQCPYFEECSQDFTISCKNLFLKKATDELDKIRN